MTYAATAQSSTVTAEYNGWSNRETWTVNLCLTNDESYYEELCRITKDYDTLGEQAEELEQYVQSIAGTVRGMGLTNDLLTISLSRVDWRDIAAANSPC